MKDKIISVLIGAIIIFWIFKWVKNHIPSPSDLLPPVPNIIKSVTGHFPRFPHPLTGVSDYMWCIIILIILFAIFKK